MRGRADCGIWDSCCRDCQPCHIAVDNRTTSTSSSSRNSDVTTSVSVTQSTVTKSVAILMHDVWFETCNRGESKVYLRLICGIVGAYLMSTARWNKNGLSKSLVEAKWSYPGFFQLSQNIVV